jgi:hypothetical protein
MEIADYTANQQLEENGTWIALDDAEFLIAAHLNKRHRKGLDRWRQKLSAGLRKQDPKAIEDLTVQAAADGVLLGWRGNVTLSGQALPYNRDNAVALLKVRALREWVLEQAVNVQNFRDEEEAADTAAVKSGAAVADPVGE